MAVSNKKKKMNAREITMAGALGAVIIVIRIIPWKKGLAWSAFRFS